MWQMHSHISQAMRMRWQPSVRVFRAILCSQKVNHQQDGEQMAWQAFASQVEAVMCTLCLGRKRSARASSPRRVGCLPAGVCTPT